MPDLLESFKGKAEELLNTLDRKGGVRSTFDSLRRQMAEADRRRALSQLRGEFKRLESQINEMIMAVGVQAVGLHQAGRLNSPELQPLCQHIAELKSALAQQEGELAKLEAAANVATPTERTCPACGKVTPTDSTFCPYCGAALPQASAPRFCASCGTQLRPESRFCAKCGQVIKG